MLLDIGNVDVSRVNGVIGLMLLDAANYYLVLKQEGPETVGSTDIITILHLLLPTFSITFGCPLDYNVADAVMLKGIDIGNVNLYCSVVFYVLMLLLLLIV